MTKKWVYLSRSAKEELAKTLGYDPDLPERKVILGGKGAGLAEMTGTGLPVPPSFTITTEACVEYMHTREFPEGMWEQTLEALQDIEQQTGKKFGDPTNPLLISVRSGARESMPGMMDTVLNLGLNDQTRVSLAESVRMATLNPARVVLVRRLPPLHHHVLGHRHALLARAL